MKRMSALIIISLILTFLSATLSFAAENGLGNVLSISYQSHTINQESLIFKLSAEKKFNVFTLGGVNPRLVVDFSDTIYKGVSVTPLKNRKFATSIRTAVHRTPSIKTRVVVDLVKSIPVTYRHKFLISENKLIITMTPKEAKTEDSEQSVDKVFESTVAKKSVQPAKKKKISSAQKASSDQPKRGLKEIQVIPQIMKLSFDDSSNRGEMVMFHLNGFYPPTVSAIEQDHPRVLCEFADAKLASGVEEDLKANGKYVQRIRTVAHAAPKKVQVILELELEKDYDLQQVFFKNDNLFVLIVNELPAAKTE